MQMIKKGVREQVYEQMKEEIISLKLEPGTMVSENELAVHFGVSRMPVHDSLLALSQNHLIDIYPQRGSLISLIDLKWVDEARFIRQTLETAVTLELFGEITQEQIGQLKQSIEIQKDYMGNGRLSEFVQEDTRFHKMLYLFAKREESYRIVSDIMVHFDRIRTMTVNAQPHQSLVQEHEEWVNVIQEKDSKTAAALIASHLDKYRENMGATLHQYSSFFKT